MLLSYWFKFFVGCVLRFSRTSTTSHGWVFFSALLQKKSTKAISHRTIVTSKTQKKRDSFFFAINANVCFAIKNTVCIETVLDWEMKKKHSFRLGDEKIHLDCEMKKFI